MDRENLKVLFVDDEQRQLTNLNKALRDEFNVLTAANAEEGNAVLKGDEDVKVVVSDQKMPGAEGTDFLSEVGKKYPDIVRLILTGYPEFEISYRAIKDGRVFDFIVKEGDYLENVRKSLVKAFDWYYIQKEMKRLRDFVRQFDETDLVVLDQGILNQQDLTVKVQDYDESERRLTSDFYVKVEKYANTLFGVLNSKEPDRSVRGLNYYLFLYDSLLDMKALSGMFKEGANFEAVREEITGKKFKLGELLGFIRKKADDQKDINELKIINLSSLVLYSSEKVIHIQEHAAEIVSRVFLKQKDEKIILRKGFPFTGESYKIKNEGKCGTAYDDSGSRMGEPDQFLEILLKKLRFANL